MAQQAFGRRQSGLPDGARSKVASGQTTLGSLPSSDAHPPEETASRSAGKSVLIVSMVAGLVLATALGVASALNSADAPSGDGVAAPQRECRGQPDCANQYTVALSCGGGEPRTITVVGADAEAAERKAERYNQGCRSSRAVFVGSLVRTAANNAFAQRAAEPSDRRAGRGTSTGRTWRFRRR